MIRLVRNISDEIMAMTPTTLALVTFRCIGTAFLLYGVLLIVDTLMGGVDWLLKLMR